MMSQHVANLPILRQLQAQLDEYDHDLQALARQRADADWGLLLGAGFLVVGWLALLVGWWLPALLGVGAGFGVGGASLLSRLWAVRRLRELSASWAAVAARLAEFQSLQTDASRRGREA